MRRGETVWEVGADGCVLSAPASGTSPLELVATYTYDIAQQRVGKALSGQAASEATSRGAPTHLHYHYDHRGRLIAETDASSGETVREYAWLGWSPVALWASSFPEGGAVMGETYFLHADHLGRPTLATDTTGALVWEAGRTTPFGQGVQGQGDDPATLGSLADGMTTAGAFSQALLFPGQYADAETAAPATLTGLSSLAAHNHHRTYDPMLGSYLQSDPIGLAGGINRYAYVGGESLQFIRSHRIDVF